VSLIIIGCHVVAHVWVRTAKKTMRRVGRDIFVGNIVTCGRRVIQDKQLPRPQDHTKSRYEPPPFLSNKDSSNTKAYLRCGTSVVEMTDSCGEKRFISASLALDINFTRSAVRTGLGTMRC